MIDLDDGTYTAVVDSIEDGLATIFYEEDGKDVASEVRDAGDLPEDGRHADALFTVDVLDGEVIDWTYNPAETEERQEAAQNRFDRLSSRPPSEDDES
ncbi:DUF3006 domain-containing protein [Halorubellus sp. PRR65]|uniref:DUF3006 domain-containing protein n=1 Tax=Halorubellus sp. PRR65 TaxID=3098148 RepID=UPI002B2602B4|nr:DUF3006 domain-containing protein [Halorubellus sp. PRR65]